MADALPPVIEGAVVMNEVLDAMPPHVVVRATGVAGAWRRRAGRRLALAERPLDDGACARSPARAFPATATTRARSILPPRRWSRTRQAAAARRAARDRLRLSARGVLPSAATRGHADGALSASRARRSVPVAGLVRSHRPRGFHGDCRSGRAGRTSVAGSRRRRRFCSVGFARASAAVGPRESTAYLREASAVQMLMSPAEMGELFKVLALAETTTSRGPASRWDMRHRLEAADSV